jgi:hypothetical protein
MSNLFTEIMILLSVPSYTVKHNYDAVMYLVMMCIIFSENLTCQAVPFALQMLTCHDVYHFSEKLSCLTVYHFH